MAQQIDPRLKDAVGKIVAAGMKVLYDPSMRQTLQKGLLNKQPVEVRLAMQVAGVLKLVDDKAKMKVPKQAMAPAAMFLIQDLANFMETAMGVKVTDEQLAAAMQLCIKILVEEYKHMGQQQPQAAPPQVPAPQAPQPAPGLIGGMQQ